MITMKIHILSRPRIQKSVLIIPVMILLITWPAPKLNSEIETVQAAVGKLPPVSVPTPEPTPYLPMEQPAVLPAATIVAAVSGNTQPESLPVLQPAITPPAESKKQPAVKTCDLVECKYYALVIRASKRHQIEPALIAAIIKAESDYDPRAVSHRGAEGLLQLMPPTAAELGVENSFNPEHNINGGVRYYKKLLKRYDGNIELALAAYNAGMQTVKKYKGVPPFKATRQYIKKVLHYYQIYKKTLVAVESA